MGPVHPLPPPACLPARRAAPVPDLLRGPTAPRYEWSPGMNFRLYVRCSISTSTWKY